MFSSLPRRERESKIVTWLPSSNRFLERFDPINPAPPNTTTRLIFDSWNRHAWRSLQAERLAAPGLTAIGIEGNFSRCPFFLSKSRLAYMALRFRFGQGQSAAVSCDPRDLRPGHLDSLG